MTCQDNCLYYPLCRDSGLLMYSVRTAKTLTLTENVEKECPFKKFKNKADFVEVVRCKDCKYYIADYCTRDIKGRTNMFYMGENDFCSYGERKGENNVKRNA